MCAPLRVRATAVNDAGQGASQGTWGSIEAAAEWRPRRRRARPGAFAAPPAAYGAPERFLTEFDIKILRSVKAASDTAPPKPHLGHQAGGAGSRSALSARN
jgi:hypothetical protein